MFDPMKSRSRSGFGHMVKLKREHKNTANVMDLNVRVYSIYVLF